MARLSGFPPSLTLPTAGLVAALLGMGTCSETGGGTPLPSGSEIMGNMVTNTIVPDLTKFRDAAEAMGAGVDAFCSTLDASTLDEIQGDWKDLSERWNAVAFYNFGPLDDDVITPKIIFVESMRQRGTDYTQTVRDELELALAGTDPLDAAFFDALTFNKVGMLALEVLVFEDSREGNSMASADIVDDYQMQPRKCDYLRGVMDLLIGCATKVHRGWTVEFADSGEAFADTMTGEELADGSEPVAALIIALHEHLAYVKDRKLEGILDAQLSGHFYPNVAATLDAIEELLVQPVEGSFGILDFIEARGFTDDVDEVKANLAAAKQAAEEGDREELAIAIGLLEGNLKREIPDGLGVDLGLTFTDGD